MHPTAYPVRKVRLENMVRVRWNEAAATLQLPAPAAWFDGLLLDASVEIELNISPSSSRTRSRDCGIMRPFSSPFRQIMAERGRRRTNEPPIPGFLSAYGLPPACGIWRGLGRVFWVCIVRS
jgi:hypothetical protein